MAKKSRASAAQSSARAKAAGKTTPPSTSSTSSGSTSSQSRADRATSTNTTPQQTRAERRANRPTASTRDTRFKAYQKQRQQALLVKIGFIALAVVVVLGAGWWGYGQYQKGKVSEDVITYFEVGDVGSVHVTEDVLYEQVPPVGGPHNATWENCGYYSTYINNVNGVHALEHGAVWVTYDPDLPQDQIDTLKDKTKQTYVLVSPYPDLPSPVVASVWGKQILLDSANDSRLDDFISVYRQNPDNTPEQGALCTLGTSATTTTPPQTTPYVTADGSQIGGVSATDATATAAAQSATSSESTPDAADEATAEGTPAP